MSSACLINHSQFVHTSNMCESPSAPPQMSITTEFIKSLYVLHGSLCSHTEATHLVRSVICNLICNLCICSSRRNYSTDIGTLPTNASAAVIQRTVQALFNTDQRIWNSRQSVHPSVFAYIRTRIIKRYVSQCFFVYMQPSALQYVHCFIPTCASAAVVKSTVQTSFNSDLRKCSSR